MPSLIPHPNPLPEGEGTKVLPQKAPPFEGEGWVGWHRWLSVNGIWDIAYGVAQVHAAAPVLVRASVAKPGPVLVGEHATLIVELLTVTTFASAPVFELPKIPGAILMQLEARPILSTEEVDGETYAVQRHELALFVMRPGVAQIPPFTVRFESPPRFGERPIEYRQTTPALQVEARLPPGAGDLPGLIVTREFHVDETWHPQPRKARVGDAFTRTVTLTAPDVPGMVFPPLPLAKVEGLTVYAKPPIVQDQVERGDLTGKRTETATYVCERPGQFTLPSLVIPWWDLKGQQLMRVTLPAVTLEVEPGPMQSADTTAPAAASPWEQWLWWIAGAMLLLVVAMAALWHKRRALLAWERRRTRHLASEPGLFAQLLDACRAGDARAAYNALLRWLDARHRGPDSATIEAFLARHPDADLRRQVELLQASILGQEAHWNGVALADGLRKARRHDLRRRRHAEEARLPDLNPR